MAGLQEKTFFFLLSDILCFTGTKIRLDLPISFLRLLAIAKRKNNIEMLIKTKTRRKNNNDEMIQKFTKSNLTPKEAGMYHYSCLGLFFPKVKTLFLWTSISTT